MEEERQNSLSLAWFLIIVFGLHVLLMLIRVPGGGKPSEGPVVVEQWDPKNQKPVVRTEKADKQASDDKRARFGGEFKNRVEQETNSPNRGQFKEGIAKGSPGAKGKSGGGANPQAEVGDPEAGDGPALSDLMPRSASPYDFDDDVKNGDKTVLNTDPYRHASFFNRITEQIYDPWSNLARAAIDGRLVNGKKVALREYVTHLRITMNREGEIISIHTVKGSGLEELDEAPRRAFWKVGKFPNPPDTLFDDSGYANFDYSFSMNLQNNSIFSMSRWAT